MKPMSFELESPEWVLLKELANPHMKRRDIAQTYALALMSEHAIDWAKVNNAIMERWSFSALEYIKNMAWKIRRGQ